MTSMLLALSLVTTLTPARDAGTLLSMTRTGKPVQACVLKNTTVRAEVVGFGATVTVTQTFRNPNRIPIEAIYTFPLPHDAAVDQMRIQTGDRIVEGQIAKREEARRTYEAARAQGMTAALLEQERANIFTQSVANILPGNEIRVQIRYVQTLEFREGRFEFSFPMTVGPRYSGVKTKDPERITPPTLPPGVRSGASIDLAVKIDAGAPIREVSSVLHDIQRTPDGPARTEVRLAKRDEIPNRDFILRYRVAEAGVQTAAFSSFTPQKGGTFALVLMPPAAVPTPQIRPRELIFVMDQSGSQNGFPIEKSKELTLKLLSRMAPGDTFNVIGFSDSVNRLWPHAMPNTPKNLDQATAFVKLLQANGGTQLENAVVAAFGAPADPERLRMVVFNTDGYAGQESVILDELRAKRGSARLFAFGIGNSVNRYLIDAMATEGRGDSEVVTLAEQADDAVDRLCRRLERPVLTDVSVDADGVTDLTPANLPDVFLARPVIVFGRYRTPGAARITVRGRRGDGAPWEQTLNVTLADAPGAPVLPSLWARRKVDDLLREGYLDRADDEIKVEQRVTSLALEYGIMSPYTSFVAVEKRIVNVGGVARTVRVPIEMASGVDMRLEARGTTFGIMHKPKAASPAPPGAGGFGGAAAKQIIPMYTLGASAALNDRDKAKSASIAWESKVAERLRKATGKLEVQVLLNHWTPELLKVLAELGLKIEAKDATLKVLFGHIDARQLKALAQHKAVDRIDPL